MNDYLLLMIAGIFVLIGIVLVLLLLEYRKLKKDYLSLADSLRRSNEDVAGLCSAAVEIDQHLANNDARLNGIIDMVNAYRPTAPQPVSQAADKELGRGQGSDYAIERIRQGVGVEELIKACGLTRDEAVLLIGLYGGKR